MIYFKIAKSVLALSSDGLGDLLAGAHICRTVAQKLPYEKASLEEVYIETANYLENRAIELMNVCHQKNYNLTEQLLLRRLPHWGNQNCIGNGHKVLNHLLNFQSKTVKRFGYSISIKAVCGSSNCSKITESHLAVFKSFRK